MIIFNLVAVVQAVLAVIPGVAVMGLGVALGSPAKPVKARVFVDNEDALPIPELAR